MQCITTADTQDSADKPVLSRRPRTNDNNRVEHGHKLPTQMALAEIPSNGTK